MAAMASDTEDLELQSLRSAVLASLKTKPSQGERGFIPIPAPALKTKEEDNSEDNDDEDLEALRLAALQSKKDGGSNSHISTPVTGSPLHISQPLTQQLVTQEQPIAHQRGAGDRGNLITITLHDFSQPQPTTSSASQGSKVQLSNPVDVEEVREEKTKFSRFESSDTDSDSDSDLDADDLLFQSENDSSGKSEESTSDNDDADSWRTRSFSNAESDSASASDAGNESYGEEAMDKRESNVKVDNVVSEVSKDKSGEDMHSSIRLGKKPERNMMQDSNKDRRDKERIPDGEKISRTDRHRSQDLRTRLKGDNRDRKRRERDVETRRERAVDTHRERAEERERERNKSRNERVAKGERNRGESRTERGCDNRRDRRGNYYKKDGDQAKVREAMGKDLDSRQEGRNSTRGRLEERKDNVKNTSKEDAILAARRQKFAPGSNLNVKDRLVKLKDMKESENGEFKLDKEGSSKTLSQNESKEDHKNNGPPSDSDISLSAEESSPSSSPSDEEDNNENESESESGSDNEMSRFKHTSASEGKTMTAALPQSRLITSMILPSDGGAPSMPRRRPIDGGERGKNRWTLNDRDGRERHRFDDRERDRTRRSHLPRHLERQERCSSRDRPRVQDDPLRRPRDGSIGDKFVPERDQRRPPREAKTSSMSAPVEDDRRYRGRQVDGGERQERKPSGLDDRLARRVAPSAKDFVSESSESENEKATQPLRSIVKTENGDKEAYKHKIARDQDRRCETRGVEEEKEPRRKERKEKRSKEKKQKRKREVKGRIGRTQDRRQRDREGMSGDETTSQEMQQITRSEDGTALKKRSVLERLGNGPSGDKSKSSVKSRLGPVNKNESELADLPVVVRPVTIDPVNKSLPHRILGPGGDSAKRRNIEMSDTLTVRPKKRPKQHDLAQDHLNLDTLDHDALGDEFTVEEPPVRRKQLSQSLLSRLSERPSMRKGADPLESLSRESTPADLEREERRVRSRDEYNDDGEDDESLGRKERLSKNRHVWSSRGRTVENNMDDGEETSRIAEMRTSTPSILTFKSSSERHNTDRVGSEVKEKSRKRDRKTKIKEVWSSSRKAVSKEASELEVNSVSKDDELDERIRKIKAQNEAILQRQKEIEDEKKMFGR